METILVVEIEEWAELVGVVTSAAEVLLGKRSKSREEGGIRVIARGVDEEMRR